MIFLYGLCGKMICTPTYGSSHPLRHLLAIADATSSATTYKNLISCSGWLILNEAPKLYKPVDTDIQCNKKFSIQQLGLSKMAVCYLLCILGNVH